MIYGRASILGAWALFWACTQSPGEPAVRAEAPSPSDRLVWHVETRDGRVLDTSGAEIAVNPASVVKVATTLWALEHLGPDHRFQTRFTGRGPFDPESGVLDGDLLVFGGGDPDFHVDNVYLVARALNRSGLRAVRGRLLVDETFWIGWEGGSKRRTPSAGRRANLMATRLREALDPARWSRATRRDMEAVAARRDDPTDPPEVVIHGGVGTHGERAPASVWLVHRSNRLRHTLERFNAYSNNDIERFAVTLGSAKEMTAMLAERWQLPNSTLRFESLSGLGSNRMTARRVVRLLRDLESTSRRFDMELDDLLPVAGCEPGTLRNYRGLPAGSVVAKTGTLARTDDGIAILAGLVRTRNGDRFFCVAAPGAGDRLAPARRDEVEWLLGRIARDGGARAVGCGPASGHSDDDAQTETFIGRETD